MAAEQLPTVEAYRIDQLHQERWTQERYRRFLGNVAMGAENVEVERFSEEKTVSLYDSIIRAQSGDPEALASVNSNVHTAGIEAIYKSAHIMKVEAKKRSDGSIEQHGQAMMGVYYNALLYAPDIPEFQERSKAEALNGHRIEDLVKAGALEDYWVVASSLYPDNMSEAEATRCGFFADTKTGVFQATTTSGEVVDLQSAFVSGVFNPTEKDNDTRPDIEAIKKVYEILGFDVSNMSVTEILSTPLLISKKDMPNGVADFVKLFDQVNGTFFGRKDLQKVDYQEYIKISAEREANLEPTTLKITEKLISSSGINDPVDAIRMLYKLVADEVIPLAGEDSSIDEAVFGAEAAKLIRHARFLKNKGYDVGASYILQRARDVSIVTMCGIGGKSAESGDKDNELFKGPESEINTENIENMNSNIRCIKCREKVPKNKVVKQSKGTWCCPKCHYEVDICTGNIKNEGRILQKTTIATTLMAAA